MESTLKCPSIILITQRVLRKTRETSEKNNDIFRLFFQPSFKLCQMPSRSCMCYFHILRLCEIIVGEIPPLWRSIFLDYLLALCSYFSVCQGKWLVYLLQVIFMSWKCILPWAWNGGGVGSTVGWLSAVPTWYKPLASYTVHAKKTLLSTVSLVRKICSPLRINEEWGFVWVNRL